MGYPMTWHRLRIRSGSTADGYDWSNKRKTDCCSLAGDASRLVADTQDEAHIARYARASGATEEQVRTIFALFFGTRAFRWEDYGSRDEVNGFLPVSLAQAIALDAEREKAAE